MATSQIPYFDLNNSQIYKAILLSKNNNILAPAVIDLTKNIYEELNINFTNTFKFISNGVEDLTCASNFTNAMLQRQVSIKATKYKISYFKEDDVYGDIDTSGLVYSNLKTTYTLPISIIDNRVISVEIMSDDYTTTYLKIDGSLFDHIGDYTITFDVRID